MGKRLGIAYRILALTRFRRSLDNLTMKVEPGYRALRRFIHRFSLRIIKVRFGHRDLKKVTLISKCYLIPLSQYYQIDIVKYYLRICFYTSSQGEKTK